jgi:hypothetical protein
MEKNGELSSLSIFLIIYTHQQGPGSSTMKDSAKGCYGFQLMVELALQAEGGPTLVDALATRQQTQEAESHGHSI